MRCSHQKKGHTERRNSPKSKSFSGGRHTRARLTRVSGLQQKCLSHKFCLLSLNESLEAHFGNGAAAFRKPRPVENLFANKPKFFIRSAKASPEVVACSFCQTVRSCSQKLYTKHMPLDTFKHISAKTHLGNVPNTSVSRSIWATSRTHQCQDPSGQRAEHICAKTHLGNVPNTSVPRPIWATYRTHLCHDPSV